MDTWAVKSFQLDDEVILRRFIPEDAGKVFETVCRNAEHLTEFMHWMVPDYSLKMAEVFIDRSTIAANIKESLGYGFFRNDRLIGSIGFVHFDWKSRKTEIGYWIDRAEQGKGLVSKASKLLIEVAFNDFDMNRIEIRCSTLNERSAAIPRRFGFKEEGRLRQAEFRNGTLHDFFVFGLLRSEWEANNHG